MMAQTGSVSLLGPPRQPPRNTPAHAALDLTDGGGLAHILLHDQVYILRITRAGKLILTK